VSRVFISRSTGASVYVFSNDHCPPHVSARQRSEDWIARIRFSYLDRRVELWSIEPIKNRPSRSSINQLLAEVQAHLINCRRSWWKVQGTVCLVNQSIFTGKPTSFEAGLITRQDDFKQIIEATYDVATDRLKLKFSDDTTEERVET
jgi:hypothetical protein